MTHWEYSEISIPVARYDGPRWRGPAGEDEQVPDVLKFLNRLGAEGWELVNHAMTESASVYTLKRPKN